MDTTKILKLIDELKEQLKQRERESFESTFFKRIDNNDVMFEVNMTQMKKLEDNNKILKAHNMLLVSKNAEQKQRINELKKIMTDF